ncbi:MULTISPECIES: Lrp/AsnC family transcriptional regulator [Thalassospira]|jgi:DNA-binding Lrp family transcriptional regulator|uniref:AsnC family transcriptional regulator n=1 Tax=Thalassospira xiamenensis TaxID=220697 RepID=A0ABR5Y527_9PROT|nr:MULTISPECIES: Lrp/AsnC family transcriptional regulator [Thalassospira]MAL30434.1 Lrp/AsnC family transcriptional regulator [Thalassospira sp.]MBR9780131.1 Lrp/AsnC family transcriptional regulator [Rhodospirillales bacterium]KZD04605.1 AsnC family transcriptional regulator [Thalassospira xiamenensis]KZD10385.1 AsnC family transcriptional regulator [Thalassospira xiamenensis]MBL4839433.1 Lrp/AsnC family transcriptional regulator [Thalassospira sp.]|tara:strand:- start:9097 stop:9513 length:417 start_codon:yes stop_codon:yes gene_type:complete
MDDLDRRLLAELRINARASVPELAQLLGVAAGTVKTRMDRLIDQGVIAGFTVRLRDDASDGTIRGVMMIELSGKNVKTLVASLRKNLGFAALHTTNGEWDLIAEIQVPALSDFHQVVTTVRTMEGIAKTESYLFLGPA